MDRKGCPTHSKGAGASFQALIIQVLEVEQRQKVMSDTIAGGETDMDRLKELVGFIAKSLVDNPEMVEVRDVAGEQTAVLELKVAPEDLGKIIGKQGKTAKAIRTILSAAAAKIKKRAVLEILE
jgi:predicted RNA-binding protein YlqC (UPF0109 family)